MSYQPNPYDFRDNRVLEKALADLPDSVEFIDIEVQRVPPMVLKGLRSQFDYAGRHGFYLWLPTAAGPQLKTMGLDDYDLAHLSLEGTDFRPHNRATTILKRSTVDHIVGLNNGGTNDISNLCLFPHIVNQLKDAWEWTQKRGLFRKEGIIQTIAPKKLENGQFNPVPLFPDQYYPF